jgi:hypothetical protein
MGIPKGLSPRADKRLQSNLREFSCVLCNSYFRFTLVVFVERRTDDDDERTERNQHSSDDDAGAARVMAKRDVARDITPALSTEFGQRHEVEHKKTSG